MASNSSPTSRSPPEIITMTAPSDSPAKATKSEETTLACEYEPDVEFQGDVLVSQDLPSQKDVDLCADMLVLGADGESRPFKSLYSGEGVATRQLIIFVRHFFCGNCQEFLRTLCASITPDALLALETPTFITIVGCGRPELIPAYARTTGCPFPIFADPTTSLYAQLGMQRSLSLGHKKPEYLNRTSVVQTTVAGIYQSIKSGRGALQGGDIRQIGGEVLFEDEQVTWIHRMKNTRDHSEIQELRRVLELPVEVKAEDEGRRGRSRGASAVSKRTSKSWSRKSDSTSDKEKEMLQKEFGYKEEDKEKRKSKRRSILPDIFTKREEEPPSPVDEYNEYKKL
ncbi:AhpC/TSA antioxidant enzyme-domain-containing protein [Phyllosticta citriasiana]|uniref:AhpC/TSA antioxidant enzyme-domain-containing protein n=1 Tax=Phyllosticta citriasiana TaxID=595635 RepID=A0ABR1KDG3_9PEZI